MSQQPEHDCEFFLVTDVAVHACECDHILVSDNNTQKEYVPIEKYASLQKQLEEQKKRYDDAIERNIDKRERIAQLEEALNTSGDLILATQAYLATISGTNIKFGKKEFQELDALATKHAKQLQALQSPPGESEKENNNHGKK